MNPRIKNQKFSEVKMKKILFLMICFAIVVSFTLTGIGCKESAVEEEAVEAAVEAVEEEAVEAAVEAVEEETEMTYKVGYAAPYLDHPWDVNYWVWWDKEMPSNWEFTVTDAQSDLNSQLNQIEDLYNMGIDVLITKAISSAGIVATLNDIWEKSGRELIIVLDAMDTDPAMAESVTAFAGADRYMMGEACAEQYIKYMDENDIEHVDYVMLTPPAGMDAGTLHKAGWLDYIDAAGATDRFNLLGEQPADWMPDKGQTVMENFIATFGDEIDMVMSMNDGMSEGAVNALKNAGYEPGEVLVNGGADCSVAGAKLVKEGWWAYGIGATPRGFARNTLAVTTKLLAGEELPYYNYFELLVMDQKNIDEMYPEILEIWGEEE